MNSYDDQLKKAFDPESFRAEGHKVVDQLADFLSESIPERRPIVLNYEDPEAMLKSWAGRFGSAPSTSFPELLGEILDRSNNLLHPRYIGHQCTTSLPLAALGGFAGQFLNNGTAVYEMGPVNVAMERQIIRWMAGLAGWGLDADGVFTSGGSIGNLTALLAARQAAAEGNVWVRRRRERSLPWLSLFRRMPAITVSAGRRDHGSGRGSRGRLPWPSMTCSICVRRRILGAPLTRRSIAAAGRSPWSPTPAPRPPEAMTT